MPIRKMAKNYWVTGHSRGGALANLVGARLIDEGKRVFAYTFAAPAVTDCAADIAHGEKYGSIFNVINTDDFVTYFPLSQWGFTRYGRSTSGVSVSGLCQTEWESRLGEEYKRMLSPEAPLDEFVKAAPTRDSCYLEFASPEYTETLDSYPSNTEKYIRIVSTLVPTINPDGAIIYKTEYQLYQSPMFLMQYFAAVASNSVGAVNFVLLNVASYLEGTKICLLSQITGLSFDDIMEFLKEGEITLTLNKKRIEYPHLPESYYMISKKIETF